MSSYRIASPFLIRLAGVPLDPIEELATSKATSAARKWLARESALASLKSAAERFIGDRNNGLSPEQFHAWRNAVRRCQAPDAGDVPNDLREYAAAARALGVTHEQLGRELAEEVAQVRRALFEADASGAR